MVKASGEKELSIVLELFADLCFAGLRPTPYQGTALDPPGGGTPLDPPYFCFWKSLFPGHDGNGAKAVFGASIDKLVAVDQVDKNVALFVEETDNLHCFES